MKLPSLQNFASLDWVIEIAAPLLLAAGE